jgi:hypothetical protein
MNSEEIMEMAIQAELNLYVHDLTEKRYIEVIEAFAKLVAAKEREACALICDDQALGAYWEGADACADRIRARGEA